MFVLYLLTFFTALVGLLIANYTHPVRKMGKLPVLELNWPKKDTQWP